MTSSELKVLFRRHGTSEHLKAENLASYFSPATQLQVWQYDYELGSTQNLPVQCHIWTIHAGSMGALFVQCFGCCLNVVHLLQWIPESKRDLQKACMVNLELVWTKRWKNHNGVFCNFIFG